MMEKFYNNKKVFWEILTIISRMEKQDTDKISNKEIHFINNNNKNEFIGILNYFRMKYGDDISKEIISASSCLNKSYSLFNVMIFEDKNLYFLSEESWNSWICFYFKNHQIIPTDYTIRTAKTNSFHLKS